MATEGISKLPAEIAAARKRIQNHVLKTPLMYSKYMSKTAEVYLKLESEQTTGSFKLRGAFNKLLTLKEREPDILAKGCTTASTGNHALACILCLHHLRGVEGIQVCPRSSVLKIVRCASCGAISEGKKESLIALNANLILYGNDCVETELKARSTAEENGMVYISPYNDLDVIAGQGTIGVEILEDLSDVDSVLVSVGGGGMIAGIAAYLKSKNKNIEIVGCQPCNSKIMYESVLAGKITHGESHDTLSDGTAGDVEEDSVTFPLCRDYVDRWITVSEEEIGKAVFDVLDKHHKVIEGSAGVAVAAFLSNQESFKGKKVVVVICGANISTNTLKTILQTYS